MQCHTLLWRTPSSQSLSLLECCSACRPAGCQPRKQSRWPYYHKSGRRTQRSCTFCLWTKEFGWLSCYAVFSERLNMKRPGSSSCLTLPRSVLVHVRVDTLVHKLVWLSRCTHSLLAAHSRQGSDQPCVVFSDGARTWSLSRGNGLFSLPCLHKEPHCSSPHIPRWLPTPGFGLPGWQGLRLQELLFFHFLINSQQYRISFSPSPYAQFKYGTQ